MLISQENYPNRLQVIEDCPKALHVYGRIDLLYREKCIAIVGARRPSAYGIRSARRFALELSRSGYLIISGFAMGIDSAAHWGALEGGGETIAVLGCGISVDYPKPNRSLKEKLLRDHLLITEHSPGVMPRAEHFPFRNRLISALSSGVLVVESRIQSGTYSTVQHGLSQGRPIFAIPGNIDAPMSQGPNHLIKSGAVPVTEPEDIIAYDALFSRQWDIR